MIIIGITGSIGMGKSTAIEILQNLGIPVYNADDAVAKFLGANGEAVKKVAESFPSAKAIDKDGNAYIDKTELSKIVFTNCSKKEKLEAILHPMVFSNCDIFAKEQEKLGNEMIAFEIPLLFESGRDKSIDVSVCISCDAEIEKQRVMEREGMNENKFESILAKQMPDAEKRERSDYVILNNGTIEELETKMQNLIKEIKTKAL